MSTSLHETLREHHIPGFMPMLPSVLLAIVWSGLQWLVYVLTMVSMPDPADTVYASNAFVPVSMAITILLLGFVVVDARRRRWPTPMLWQLVAEGTAALLLVVLFVFLMAAERALS